MKNLNLSLFILALLCLPCASLFAQTNNDSKALVKEGITLNDAGKYDEALAKYSEALKIDSTNFTADYEMAFTLYAMGKGQQAIPYLQKILASPKTSKYETYDILGSIYDDNNEADKAIEAYKAGIKENPNFEHLYFNLGISYLRKKRDADAESCEIEAIKLDPKHASAQRIYGLATYNEGKKVCAVMAFCSFLLLEPKTDRSKQVYGYLDQIFKSEQEQKNIYLNIDSNSKEISPMSMANMSVNLAAAAKLALAKKSVDSVENLELALKMIFETVGKISAKPTTTKDFFWTFYADYFYQLAESGNLPAFVRLISLPAYRDGNLAWIKDNQDKLNALDMWIRENPRTFK